MKKRMFAMLLAMVMVLSLLPVSAFAADVVIVPAAEDGWEEIGTATGSSYEDTTAESDTEYEYMVVGSDGSTQTVAVTAETPDGGTGDTTGGDETYENDYGTATKNTSNTTTEGSTYYELVTNGVNGITSGEEYLIVSSSSGTANALTIAPGRTSVQITDGKITSVDSNAVFTITGDATSGYTLKNGDKYINYTSSGSWYSTTYTLASGQNSQAWTLSDSGTNGVTISVKPSYRDYYIRYNNGFSLSTSSSTLYLFKKVVEPGENVTTTYDVSWNEVAQELLNTCNPLNSENYTEETWAPFAEALEAANAAKDGQTSFDTMDAAKAALDTMTALKDAYDALVKTEVYVPNIQWERTLEPKSGTIYNAETNGRLVRDLQYIDQYNTNDYSTISWTDTDVLNLTTDPSMTVWDYNTDAQYSNQGKIAGIQAATWMKWGIKTDGTSWKFASVRKISGSFTWPEGYDLDDTITLESVNDGNYQAIYEYINQNETYKEALGDRKVIAINDDMYVYVYLDDDKPTSLTDDSYLAFFTGSVGKGIWSCKTNTNNDWARTVPATYNNTYATRAFYYTYPNMETSTTDKVVTMPENIRSVLSHTDGWYTFVDGSTVSTVLKNHYAGEALEGRTVHIDIYCFDNSNNGGMDAIKLKFTKTAETTASVTVNYYLNSISDENKLLSSTITGAEIGSTITLPNGYTVNELNYAKAKAIEKAGNKDVTDGKQQGTVPYVVQAENNVINVVYTVKDDKAIELHAGSAEVPYDGYEHNVTDYDVKMNGQKISQNADGTYTTVDGNYIQNVIETQGHGTLPGKYEITVKYNNVELVKDKYGNNVTNSYKVTNYPGTLTITYAPSDAAYTYDFGVANKYENVLNEVEKQATVSCTNTNVQYNKADNSITYTPSSVNTGETVTLTLAFSGGYTTTKTINFLPATNVLYEEGFVSTTEDTDWTKAGTAAADMTVTDNETTAYGYTDETPYTENTEFSAGTALKAVLTKDQATKDATFTFTGTGFDLISECGTNTGMLIVGVKDADGNAKKAYLVDTYFCGDEEYVTGEGILAYQVPVVRNLSLDYGEYTVTVRGYLTKGSGAVKNNTAVATLALDDADTFSVDQVFAEAGMSEYLSADVEIVYMDDNSILNGGTGPAITETTVTDTTEETSETESTGFFGKLLNFFKNLSRSTTLESAAPVAENTQTTEGTEISAYIDGFRVYQPKGTEETAYETDEQGTKYYSLYDFVKTSVNEGWTDNTAVYIEYDGSVGTGMIAEYKDQGPQNEVYLAPGASIVFGLEGYTEGDTVQVSAKQISDGEPIVEGLDFAPTATEMYYDVETEYDPALNVHYVVVANDTEATGILALSALKVSEGITAMASAELANNVIELEKAENDAFQPEKFTITAPTTAKLKRSYTIKISASTDVEKVVLKTQDGTEHTLMPSNTNAVANGSAEYFTFSKAFKQTTAGDYIYTITAYDETGKASVATDVTVNVQ